MSTTEQNAKNGKKHTESIEVERIALYLRVSGDDQTIDMQRDYLKKHALENHWRIFTEFVDETRTGKTMDREGFQNLLKSIEYKGFDGVLVYKSDRLFRNAQDAMNMIKTFKDKGITLLSATDQQTFDRFGGADSRFLSTVMLGLNEYWSDTTKEKILDGKKYALAKGYYCARPPLGYKVIEHKLVLDDDKAQIVKEIFADRQKGMSWGQLSSKYNIKKSTLQGIIQNPIYTKGLEIKATIEGKEKVVGKVEPIIKG